MPTISQLPAASPVTAADQIPISQGGSACAVDVGSLLTGLQPAIMIATGSLSGRTSLGPGGPEPVAVGTGLSLHATTLVATGADHAGFPLAGTLALSDQAVLSSTGSPRLLPLPLLRGLFSPGANIAIDQNGTISAILSGGTSSGTPSYSVAELPATNAASANDLLAISQSGTDHAISYANFLDGQTIDQLQPAAPATDADNFLVAQGNNTLMRQSLAAIWNWLSAKLASYQYPTIEVTANATLNAAAHNGRMLICSQPVVLTPAPATMGNGFSCSVVNVSDGNVTFASGVITASGNASLPPGQAANVSCLTYSGGTLVYAWTSGSAAAAPVPGQVSGLATGNVTATSVALTWSPLLPPPTNYTVQYRVSGTTPWSQATPVTTAACTVSNLIASTSYDFAVFANNSAGSGSASATVTATTTSALSAPGQVTGVTAGSPTANTLSLGWSQPVTGGTVASYTVQYRQTGTTPWSTAVSGVTATTDTVTGLAAATSYDFQVTAVNATGTGPASAVVTATTAAAANSVTSITWNIVPSGSYTHGSGAIGVNAQITPATAPVQFGFCASATSPPTSWTAGILVNSNLWGAYVNTPPSAGTWYAWCEGTDGSHPTVYPTGFTVT